VFHPNDDYAALAPLAGDPIAPPSLRTSICQALAKNNPTEARAILLEAMRVSSERVQTKLAQGWAGTASGAETLLQLVEKNHALARLLTQRGIKEKVLAAKPSNAQERVADLTKNVMPRSEEIQKLIDARRGSFDQAKAQPTKGYQVFTQSCGICHQVEGVGTVVGPQLDGIGNRGLERLLEDVLDPNRNVDPAFHTTTVVLKDDEVLSGLFRREEGEAVVIADSTGKEITIPKKNIIERRATDTSLMPDNFGEVIPPEEFNNLMAFLLLKSGKPPGQQ
jgi:putative heme-binding domain-containing protein